MVGKIVDQAKTLDIKMIQEATIIVSIPGNPPCSFLCFAYSMTTPIAISLVVLKARVRIQLARKYFKALATMSWGS